MATSDGTPEQATKGFLAAARLADLGVLPNALARSAAIEGIPELRRPKWVARCREKVCAALFPKVQELPSFGAKGESYEPGFAIGLIEAGIRMLGDIFDRLEPWLKARQPTDDEVRKGLHDLFGEHGDWLFEVFKEDGNTFFEAVADYESKLSLGNAANYRQGQADALKMVAGENRKNDATDIHLFMLLYWRVVDRLESVDHLHRVLIKVFGRNRAGYDPKRVAQICHRIGKKYRARGRPKKQPQQRLRLR